MHTPIARGEIAVRIAVRDQGGKPAEQRSVQRGGARLRRVRLQAHVLAGVTELRMHVEPLAHAVR